MSDTMKAYCLGAGMMLIFNVIEIEPIFLDFVVSMVMVSPLTFYAYRIERRNS